MLKHMARNTSKKEGLKASRHTSQLRANIKSSAALSIRQSNAGMEGLETFRPVKMDDIPTMFLQDQKKE